MAKSTERMQAIGLRRSGKSVKEIAKELHVSPGSVSIWTRDIVLTDSQRKFLQDRQIASGHKGRMIGTEVNKKKKQVRIAIAKAEAIERIKRLSKQDLFWTGLGLYWGEGVKAATSSTAVVNSDSRIIKLMMRWFMECWDVDKIRLQPRVYISDLHRDREEEITQYWVKTLGLPRTQFRKMVFLNKGKKIYENRNVYYGVLTLRIEKGGDLKYKILACIERASESAHMSM
jgi:Homeodomain-like domain